MEYSPLEQYSNEWKRERLRQGQPLFFPSHLPEKSRTIQADWLEEAVSNGVAVDVQDGIIEGPLNFESAVFHKKFALKRSRILCPANFSFATFQQALDLSASVFLDTLDFISTRVNSEVEFVETTFKHRAEFRDARMAGAFDCRKAIFHGVSFQRVTFDKSALFREARFEGGKKADFTSARIGGQAGFTKATFTGPAVFYETRIIQDAFFNPTIFADLANFAAAQIEGTAYFDFGTVFGGWASFNMVKVKLSAFFDQSRFEKNADFGNIVIGGQAAFIGAQFVGKTNFDEAEIMGRALFHGTEFQGSVFFVGAKFHSGVFFQHAILGGDYYHGTVFHQPVSFEAASFGPRVQFDSEVKIYGDTGDSTLVMREDLPLTERLYGSVDLRGCVYERIDVASWEQLMERLKPFDRQPYVQLEKTFRLAGEDRLADAVYFKRRRLEGIRKTGLHRISDEILRALVGYGVKPLRLFSWIFACVFLGAIVFQMEGAVRMRAVEETEPLAVAVGNCREDGTCQLPFSEAFWFSLSIFSPVELPKGGVWKPSMQPIMVRIKDTELSVMSYATFASILKLAGWIIVPVGIAGLTGLFKRSGAI